MDELKSYTITIETDNKPGVLYRIAGIFVRRKINIESLYVYETKMKGLSKFTIIANMTEYNATRVLESIRKVVEVKKANVKIKK